MPSLGSASQKKDSRPRRGGLFPRLNQHSRNWIQRVPPLRKTRSRENDPSQVECYKCHQKRPLCQQVSWERQPKKKKQLSVLGNLHVNDCSLVWKLKPFRKSPTSSSSKSPTSNIQSTWANNRCRHLFDLGSELNAIHPDFAKKLGLST